MKTRLFRILPLALLSLAGCGYSGGAGGAGYTWGSVYRQDVKTVAVPVFTTRSFFRGDEQRLTQSLINQLESRTPYKVVQRSGADTALEGEVISVSLSTVSQHPDTSLPQEQLYTVVIDFTWKDLRSGTILVERRNFEQTVTYYPALGDGRFHGSQQAVEQLAAGIVEELQANW